MIKTLYSISESEDHVGGVAQLLEELLHQVRENGRTTDQDESVVAGGGHVSGQHVLGHEADGAFPVSGGCGCLVNCEVKFEEFFVSGLQLGELFFHQDVVNSSVSEQEGHSVLVFVAQR